MLSRSSNKVFFQSLYKGAFQGTLLLLFFLPVFIPSASARQRDTLGTGHRTHFVANFGQWKNPSLFQAQMHNAALFAESGCLTIALRQSTSHNHTIDHFHHEANHNMFAYKIHFLNSNPSVLVTGHDPDPNGGYDNYYYGHDPQKWVSGLVHYQTVLYHNLYPGIDMDIQVAQHALKTNFYIAPQTDPSIIKLHYDGPEKIFLSNGNLIVRTSIGDIVEIQPYAFQTVDTGIREIFAQYRLHGDTVHFLLGDYDSSLPLTIDPVLHFSTYTGSSADNWGTTATYDAYKNTYTAGLVFGIGYPASVGAYDNSANGNADVGIFKFDTSGTQRLFATYLGGSQADMPHSMYVNTFDELVIFGTTGSDDFPVTPNAYDTSFNGGSNLPFEGTTEINFPNGSDIFVCRFSSDGSQLQASTYVGGSENDGLNYRTRYNAYNILMNGNDSLYFNYGDGARGELITDDLNNVYIGSTTFSTNFPTTPSSVFPYPALGQNGIVFKIDYNLRNMIWSTFLGGSSDDAVYSIDVDSSYNLLVCGGTNSHDFPTTTGACQTMYGGGSADGFISKISYNGDRLMASTLYGSSAYDQIYFVRSGKQNEVFIFGQTKAPANTFIYNASYNVPGSGMLLARLHPNLDGRQWSTVFGTPMGSPNLSPTAFAADICNRIYAAGWGRDFVGSGINWNQAGTTGMETTSDAIQTTTDGQDFYIMSMSADASTLDFATFFGELHSSDSHGGYDHVDGGTSRFDKMATLYQSVCASCYGNDNFPTTPGAWSIHNCSNNCNNALFRINIHNDFAVADFLPPPVGCEPYDISFTNTGRGSSYLWDFGDGATSTLRNPQHTYNQAGTYRVRLISSFPDGCKTSDTIEHTVRVLSNQGHSHHTQVACNGGSYQIGPRPMLGCSYQWIEGQVSDSSIANPYVSQSGSYVLQISALGGCTETDTFHVEFISLLDSLIVQSPTCPGGNNGRAIAIPLSSIADSARYFWDGIEGDSILLNLSADGRTHTFAIESHGCRYEQTFTIQDPPTMQIKKQANTLICNQGCTGFIHLDYTLPSYHVGDTLLDSLCPGTYITTVYDTSGCPYYDTTVIVLDTSLLHLSIWADETFLYLNESTHLHVTPVPGARYSWSNSNTLDRPSSSDPLATPTDTLTRYQVTVTDTLGCTWTGDILLHCTEVICGRPNVFIPNTFSPNGDGINDRLCFHGDFITDFYLAIYTRWGEKVFETHDINSCWDGRYNDNWCMPGVYTYSCRIQCEAGLQNHLKGDITLIR